MTTGNTTPHAPAANFLDLDAVEAVEQDRTLAEIALNGTPEDQAAIRDINLDMSGQRHAIKEITRSEAEQRPMPLSEIAGHLRKHSGEAL